jgi:tRNA pseudouridine38-40 synthase
MPAPQSPERIGNQRGTRSIGHAHNLTSDAGRVQQRPQQIHDGGDPKLFAHWPQVAHRGVVVRREQEYQAAGLEHLRGPLRSEIDVDTQRLEDVGRPGFGGVAPVAVLGDGNSGPGHEEGSGGRDVEGSDLSSPSPAGIDQGIGRLETHLHHRYPESLSGSRHFVGRLPLHPKTQQQRSDLRRGGRTSDDDSERSGGLVPAERPPLGQLLEGQTEREIVHVGSIFGAREVNAVGVEEAAKVYPSRRPFVKQDKQLRSLLGLWHVARFPAVSRTFLATLHYDGTGFVGWQRQPTGRSVQSEFERVLQRIFGRRTVAHAAGRTDAGVHAIGQAVSFGAPATWTDATLRRALNALLPHDCWVAAVQPMHSGFHARKSALTRRYRYDVGLDDGSASPFRRRFEWALGRPLKLEALQAAAGVLRGEHDFRAFASKGDKPHYRCRLLLSEWRLRPEDRGISFEVEADRFLHHMVRMLVGTMVDVGLGRRPIGDIEMLLGRTDNADTSPPAPAHGLYFVAATYPPELYDTSAGEIRVAAALG